MDIDPFNFADALLGILAQRLVRTLCKDCKEEYAPTQEEFAELMQEYGLEHWDKLGLRYSPDFRLYRPKGCAKCGGTGLQGPHGHPRAAGGHRRDEAHDPEARRPSRSCASRPWRTA